MRILYLFLKYTLKFPIRVFYPRIKIVNEPKKYFGSTIYVSNHAASFMDPLTTSSLTRPIVFFMTRSDVFTTLSKPILWACQMLPIYRQHDGDDAVKKNEAIFVKCSKILKQGRGLLIYGEGFTDDIFIRRLKKVKKGAVRIGFLSLEKINWNKKIHLCAVGCNYSSPNQMRSDFLISFSDKICLNDYKEEYLKNSNKVINDLTLLIEKKMQEQITHNEKENLAPLHERIMVLTRKGMNAINFDRSISLEKRWKYSQKLATWLNSNDRNEQELEKINQKTLEYNTLLKKRKLKESLVFWKLNNPKGLRVNDFLKLFILLPFAIIGAIQCAIPYFFTKKLVENMMKRPVFWSSVKMIIGISTIALFNIPSVYFFNKYISINGWMTFAYFMSIGLTGLSAYVWMLTFRILKEKGKMNHLSNVDVFKKREEVLNALKQFLPEEFH